MVILKPVVFTLATVLPIGIALVACAPRATVRVQDNSPIHMPRYAEGCIDHPDVRSASCREGFRRASIEGDSATAGQLLLLSQGNAASTLPTTLALWLNQAPWLPATFPALRAAVDDVFVPAPKDARGALLAFDVSVDEDLLPANCPVVAVALDPPTDTAGIETATLAAAAAGAIAITWESESQIEAAPALPLLSATLGGVVPHGPGLRWAIFAGRADHALRLGDVRAAYMELAAAIHEVPATASPCHTTATLSYWLWLLASSVGEPPTEEIQDIAATVDKLCSQRLSSEADRRWGEILHVFIDLERSFREEPGLRDAHTADRARQVASGAPTRVAALLSAMANGVELSPTVQAHQSVPRSAGVDANDLASQLITAGRPDWGAWFDARSRARGVLDTLGRTDRARIERLVNLLGSRSHRWHSGVTAADTLAYITGRADIQNDPNATIPLCAILTDTIRSMVQAEPKPAPSQRALWAFRLAAATSVCADEKPLRETFDLLVPRDEPQILAVALSQAVIAAVDRPEIAQAALESIGTWARLHIQTLDASSGHRLTKLYTLLTSSTSAWLTRDQKRFWPSIFDAIPLADAMVADVESTRAPDTRSTALVAKLLTTSLQVAGALRFGNPADKEKALADLDRMVSEEWIEILEIHVPHRHHATVQRMVRLVRSLLTVAAGHTPSAGDQLDWVVLAESLNTPTQTDVWDQAWTATSPLIWALVGLAQKQVGDEEGSRRSQKKAYERITSSKASAPSPDGLKPWTYQSLIYPITVFSLSKLDGLPAGYLSAPPPATTPSSLDPPSPLRTDPQPTDRRLSRLIPLLDSIRSASAETQVLDQLRHLTDESPAEPLWDALLFARAVLEQRLGLTQDVSVTLQRYLSAVAGGSPGDALVICHATASVGNIEAAARSQFRLALLPDWVRGASELGVSGHAVGIGSNRSYANSDSVQCRLELPPAMAVDLVLEAASALAILSMIQNSTAATDTHLTLAAQAAHLLTYGKQPVLSEPETNWLQMCRDSVTAPGHDGITTAAWATALGRLRGHGLVSQELDSSVWEFARSRGVPVSSTFVHSSPIPRLLPQNHAELHRIRPLAIGWSLAQHPTDTGTLVAASKALSFRTVLLPPWGAQLAGDVLRAALGDVPTSVVNSPLVQENKDPTGHAVTTMWRNLMMATGTSKVSAEKAEEIVKDLLNQGFAGEAALYASRLAEIAIAAGSPEIALSVLRTLDPPKGAATPNNHPDWLRGRLLEVAGRSLAVSGKWNDAALTLESANQVMAGLLPTRNYYEKLLAAINIRGAAQRYTRDLERDTEKLTAFMGQTFGYGDPMVFRLQTATLALKVVLDRPWADLGRVLHNRAVADGSAPIVHGKRFVDKLRQLDQPEPRRKLANAYLAYLFQNAKAPD